MNILRHKDKILGLLISIIFIGLICWNLDFGRLIATFKIFNDKVLCVFVPLYVLSLYIRGFRWKCLLYNDKNFHVKDAFFIFTTGNTLNSYLPARAGDFWRAFHVGKLINQSKMKILGSIILERIIDGVSVLLILLFAVLTYCKQPWILQLTYIAAILFLGSLFVIYFILKFDKSEVIFEKLSSISFLARFKPLFDKASSLLSKFLLGFQALNSPKSFFMAFGASCVAWGIECILTYILILGFGHHYGISIAMFVISFLALSTIIPSSSIFVGPYQYAYILALGLYHIDKSNGLGIAFVHQITIMLIITIISIVYFNSQKTNLSEIRAEIETKED